MSVSIIEKLKQKELTIELALQTLIDVQSGMVNLELLDADVASRFKSKIRDRSNIPPIVPLLL